jgi:tryptophanyl-tRNA synthetase
LKNSESNKSKLRRYFWKWIKKAKEIELNNNAQIIQKFCKHNEKKKLRAKQTNKNKLSILLKAYLITKIKEALTDVNEKYLKPINKALDKINGVDKRYATNNIITFANDTIRRQLLLYILNKKVQNNKNDLLR